MSTMKRGIAPILCLCLCLTLFTAANAEEKKANPAVAAVCGVYNELMLGIASNLSDVLLMTGSIAYSAADIDKSRGVSMVYGGAYSPKDTYVIGMGAGLENDDLWYISFTYQNADTKDIYYTMLCAILGTAAVGVDLGGESDIMESAKYIISALVGAGTDIALELDGVVYVMKALSSGTLFAIDSKAYYDTFYKGSIDNYQTLR